MRIAGYFLLFLLGIGVAGTAEAAIPTNKAVARVYAHWLEQEAPQAPAAEGKVARALAAALTKIADGGDINATDKTGHTALMMAAAIDHRPAMDFLLLSGADPYLKNAKGRTALDMAKQDSIRELMKASAIMDKDYSPAELEQLKVEVDEALKKLKPSAANGIDLVRRNEVPWELFAKCLKCGKLPDDDKAAFTVRVFAFLGSFQERPDLTLLALKTGMDPSEEFVFQHSFAGVSRYTTTPLNMAISHGGWGVLQFRKVSQAVAAMADVRKTSGAWEHGGRVYPPLFIKHWRFDDRDRKLLESLLLEAGAVSKGDAVAETMVKSANALSSKANFITALQKSGQKLDKLDDEATARLYSLISPYWDKELAALLKKRGFRFKALAAPGSKALPLVLTSSPQVQALKDLQKLGAKPENDEDALKLACLLGDAKTVAKLTKKGGVDAELLRLAPHAKIAQLLIKAGADVKSGEKDSSPLIQKLIWSDAPAEVLQVVIEAGAPLPEEPVSSVEHIEIAQVLSKAGCKIATEEAFFPIRILPWNS